MDSLTILDQLQQALKLSANAQFSRHPAGAVNHVYRLQDKETGVDFAVKWLGDDNFSGVNRRHQFSLQQRLYHKNIAPEPILLSDDECIWVESWQRDTRAAPPCPEALANVLARIHQLAVKARPLNLSSRWQHYLTTAQSVIDDALRERVAALKRDVQDSESMHEDIVLCHNDLLSGHVLCREGNAPVVIDWEYSAMGNRYFDLASCCLINKFDEEKSHQLLSCYADRLSIPQQEAVNKFKIHKAIVDMTNTLWFKALHLQQP